MQHYDAATLTDHPRTALSSRVRDRSGDRHHQRDPNADPAETVFDVFAQPYSPSPSNWHSGEPDLRESVWGDIGNATSHPVTLTDLSVRLNVFGTAADHAFRGIEVGLPTSGCCFRAAQFPCRPF